MSSAAISYQIIFSLNKDVRLRIGRPGIFDFPAGKYIYTGSARKNMDSRLARHLRKDKKPHWHICFRYKNYF